MQKLNITPNNPILNDYSNFLIKKIINEKDYSFNTVSFSDYCEATCNFIDREPTTEELYVSYQLIKDVLKVGFVSEYIIDRIEILSDGNLDIPYDTLYGTIFSFVIQKYEK